MNTSPANASEFSFPLDLRGTEFQLACWNALLKIPYGETRSYRDIAEAIGHPRPTAPSACRTIGIPSPSSFPATA